MAREAGAHPRRHAVPEDAEPSLPVREPERILSGSFIYPHAASERVSGDRALFLGRFQPFHLGHLDVVKRLAREHAELVVAIGSAQVSHTPSNPFTVGERIEMIHLSLREAGIMTVLVTPIPDVGRNSIWVSHVRSYVPSFSALYTNNPLMTRLFQEAGHKVLPAPFHAREKFEGSRIRQLMIDGGEWRALVPGAVARVIDACDGVRRVKDIAQAGVVVEGRDPEV